MTRRRRISTTGLCVLRGRLEVLVGDQRQLLGPGDYLTVRPAPSTPSPLPIRPARRCWW
ncbi:MAG TPA: hypothetical protein VIL37_09880 [Natronosporangium sp.]